MKQMNNGIILLMTSVLMLVSPLLYAAEPKFSIIPVSGAITSILLPSNFTETVSYQVTNNTKLTRTLTMVPITAVSQTTTGNGACGNTFTLGYQQSCTLTLVINGSQVPSSGIKGGPVICKTKSANDNSPDPLLCSQPNEANILDISVTTPGQHAYVANQVNNSLSVCQVNPATGLLTQCSVQATGLSGVEGVGVNPAGTFLYTANITGSNVSICNVNQSTGTLSNCSSAGGSNFHGPDAVAFNPSGTIFYTSNAGNGGSVSACLVNPTTGQLSSCQNNTSATFSLPSDMALNAAGTLAYVVNRTGNTISVCNVSGQSVTSCNDLSGSLINQPEGITLDISGLHAYIANAGDNTVVVCDILQDGTGLLANCSYTNGQYQGTGNVAFNNSALYAYIPNQLLNMVFTCQVSPIDGSLSSCLPSLNTGFDGPSGIAIN